MKIRIPDQVAKPLMERLGPTLIRTWLGSTRQKVVYLDSSVQPVEGRFPKSAIYVIWHESIIYPIYKFGGPGSYALVSESRDGEIIARVGSGLGWQTLRGSSSRGAIRLLKQALRVGSQQEQTSILAIAGDGPRGPRRQLKPGALYLSAKTGLPIVPGAFVYRDCWRINSWDRMLLPKPFTNMYGLVGRPEVIPADIDAEGLERKRVEFQTVLEQIHTDAEALAGGASIEALPSFGQDSCRVRAA